MSRRFQSIYPNLFWVAVVALMIPSESVSLVAGTQAADKPNIVWIVSEDNSKHYLKLFDERGTETPNIEKLANHGLIFDRAFSCSPVCSVARTTLATCVYGPRIGTQYHRRSKMANLPAGWKMFPAYLRQAGYYTTNNSKTDYNTPAGKDVWNESSKKASWRKRPTPTTPFFHMESHGTSHESSLHFNEQTYKKTKTTTDPSIVKLAAYHPDTPLFRYTYARYHDRIRQIDGIVGKVVADLKAAGQLENTFIFYFGDHGGVLPRGKGYAQESGLHVPLVVRVPEKWAHMVDRKVGSRVPGFVEFVDFGATALSLAGVDVPKHMDGKPFLGKNVTSDEVDARDEAFGYADRFDEKYDLVRTLRKGKFKYIRNYQAYYPDGLQNNYRYRMLAYKQWRTLYKQGKLNAAQRQFFESRAAEGLYDLNADPDEVNNLANDPKYHKTLLALRARLAARVKALPDLSMYPESYMVDHAMSNTHAFAQKYRSEITKLVDTADLCLLPPDQATPKLKAAMASENRWVRYWAATAAAVMGKRAASLKDQAVALLRDEELLVRLRAAEFLAVATDVDVRPAFASILKESKSDDLTLLTLNGVVFLRDHLNVTFDFTPKDITARGGQVPRRIEYLFGKSAANKKPGSKGKK